MTFITEMLEWAYARLEDEEGQGLVEYALILFLISIAAIAVMPGLGTAITNIFTNVTTTLTP